MKLVISGATGLVGSEVLRQALADPAVEQVVTLTRRPLSVVNPKLKVHVLDDFLDYTSLGADLRADACIWCLGVSQTAVGHDDYVRITHDYAVAAARALIQANQDLRFCFVSGARADPQERSTVRYARIKGRTEKALRALSPNVTSFRPAFIRPPQGRKRPLVVTLYTPLANVMDHFTDGFSVECTQLARCLLAVARHGTGDAVLDNAAIRRWR
ncbi:Oxidoreductase [plant metagenome]|uniref:Oxidoreductase n=1 Tax=plant metagenome TaxID=1297885 RepID=A0A484Q7P3_9ZZZZ